MAEIQLRTGTFDSFDGTPIYYEVRGEGPPIVLCYGIACLINHWSPQLRYFSKKYQTIVFDYRGHHQTPAPKNRANLSIDAIAEDMRLLLDHLQVEDAAFWGHSYGAQILLKFYDLYPQRVSSLVFINGFARNPIQGMFGIDAVPKLFELFKKSYARVPKVVSKIWHAAVSNPIAIPISSFVGGFNTSLTNLKDIEVYARGVASMDLDVFITLFEQMMDYDASNVLDKIDKPTLIIAGEKDGVTPIEFQNEMHDRIAGSEILRVPYGSHCTQLDLPDFVNLRIEKFLNEIGYAPHSTKKSVKPKSQRKKAARPWRGDL